MSLGRSCGPLRQWSPRQKGTERPVLYTQVKVYGDVLHERYECHIACHNHGDYGRCRFLFPHDHEIVGASYFDADMDSIVISNPTKHFHCCHVL